jgi:hypothetical protein
MSFRAFVQDLLFDSVKRAHYQTVGAVMDLIPRPKTACYPKAKRSKMKPAETVCLGLSSLEEHWEKKKAG